MNQRLRAIEICVDHLYVFDYRVTLVFRSKNISDGRVIMQKDQFLMMAPMSLCKSFAYLKR